MLTIMDKSTPTLESDGEVTIPPLGSKQNTKDWQRISPIAIMYFLAKFVMGFLSNIVVFLPALYLGYDNFIAHPHLWLPIGLAILAIIMISTFLSFYFFQYRLYQDHIEIRSGVISKKYVNLPFAKIQNVKLEQPLYYRLFGFTCLQLDTAGSAMQEAKVVALKVDFAEQLKVEILAQHKIASSTVADAETETVNDLASKDQNNETILNTRSITDLIIHGLTNNRIWIFLGGLAPFFDDFGRYIVEFFNGLGIDLEKFLTFADKPMWQVGLYALTLTFIILLPFTLFSIAGSIITFYQFTLSKVDDRYIRRSGLLTKYEVIMRLSRLQMVVRQQDWLDVILKRINLKFEQSNSALNQYQASAENNRIIVPSINPSECLALVNNVYPTNKMMTVDYQSISKRFLLRNLGYILTPIFISLLVFFITVDKTNLLMAIIPGYLFVGLLIFMRWFRWGYAKDEDFIYIRKGYFGVDYYCFPIFKTQQVQFKQSWFQKRHQLSSVSIVLAAGAQDIPFIKQEFAYQLLDNALYQVESSRKSWM
ncbi:PH domain-containing protein [Colwellia sp. BRX8-3]|nr:PH domain-containing protein [Colwellia sp. BRX8-9]MBA6353846.1 PH domain-containing protein [Colwellia sp. BRX9-1]MBA6357883.1 PH domain-containing protein [Colwellia sp. BRX8-3]MBA6360448.1 PH domain-containing protein [Colwellia sp. BRX8-6]MBA6368761.1 PH domain-containing protein [Colwellia sp. BRX8-5]MBA6376511.1 PH domain-containing protein [Colwellia sp. BRX8-2]